MIASANRSESPEFRVVETSPSNFGGGERRRALEAMEGFYFIFSNQRLPLELMIQPKSDDCTFDGGC